MRRFQQLKKTSDSTELLDYQSSFGFVEDFKSYCMKTEDIIWAKLIRSKDGTILIEYDGVTGFYRYGFSET